MPCSRLCVELSDPRGSDGGNTAYAEKDRVGDVPAPGVQRAWSGGRLRRASVLTEDDNKLVGEGVYGALSELAATISGQRRRRRK
jgi:hypothetical protein